MNRKTYLLKRAEFQASQPSYRSTCTRCFQPEFGCYCAQIKAFDPGIQFNILIHPIEMKRRIATGRMAHLNLEGSTLIRGQDYSENPMVNAILGESSLHSVILYPGAKSQDLTPLTPAARNNLFPKDQKLSVFVIDGTWATARKMLRSQNLINLPRICFSPDTPSNFRVRKQPAPGCYSTIEAIHRIIELLDEKAVLNRTHDRLLNVFNFMVERQLRFIGEVKSSRQSKYRRERNQPEETPKNHSPSL